MTELFKIIIIDDEPLIRNGLKKMFPWHDFDMQIAETFANGTLALEYIKLHPIDLVITDIKMPVMSGLDFMKECQRQNIKTKFIILSGFSDFEYVKRAAQIGIENYLLKPIDTHEMTQTLLQVKDKLIAEQKHKLAMDEGIRILKNNLLFRLTTAKISYNELEDRKDYIDIPMDCCDYQIATIKFTYKYPDKIPSSKPPIPSVIHHLTPYEGIFPITDYTGRFLYLLFCNYSQRKHYLETCFKQIISYVSTTSDYRIFIAVGPTVSTIDAISDSYKTAALLINTASQNNSNPIRWAEDLNKNKAFMFPHIEVDQLLQLNEQCLYKSEEKVLEVINDILHNNQFIPLSGFQMLSTMIASKIYSNCRIYRSDSLSDDLKIYNRLTDAYSYTDYDSIIKWLKNIIHDIFSSETTGHSSHSGTTNIKKIIQYIHENYMKDINLQTIADIFHLNALYLGRRLKQETGASFPDYINHLRLEKAKDLLINTSLSAKQISDKVGYSNDKYFNNQFKKHTNMTPGEYRRKNNQHTT